MPRSNRLFEIIQLLRAAPRPVTADTLAEKLEVSTRTIYRDISALQGMHTPIDGEPGIGYMMRSGYDLPPLNFDREEVEALRVGLLLLSRTGDTHLQKASRRIFEKVDALHGPAEWLRVAPWGAPPDSPERGCIPIAKLRAAIRDERKLRLDYRKTESEQTFRTIRPVGLVYHLECTMLAAWCELRAELRQFRTDRIYGCEELDETFTGQGETLRALWVDQNQRYTSAPA
ncbi:MAG: YafY family protein [Pseudomonadota bacterium]